MSYSPRSKIECIRCLEVCYGRKLTPKEKTKTYKELYAWFKSRQKKRIKQKDSLIKKLQKDITEGNKICTMLGIEKELKYITHLKEEVKELATII